MALLNSTGTAGPGPVTTFRNGEATNSKFGVALLCLTVAFLIHAAKSLYHARRRIARLRDAGLPIAPGWNWITGNLLLMTKMGHIVPSKATKVTLFGEIVRLFPKEGCCYLDLWPLSRPFLLIMDPDMGAQACQTESIAAEKPPELAEFFVPITGGSNLFDLPSKEWKSWRTIFNRGFSDNTINLMVPGMVEETQKYCTKLTEKARVGKIFQLDPISLRYAIDFIGTTALNSRLNSQQGYDGLADSMLDQIRWLPKLKGANPFENLNFVRIIVQWWNGKKMNDYIGQILDRRYQEHLDQDEHSRSSRSVIDLIIQFYISEQEKESQVNTDGVLTNHTTTGDGSTKISSKLDPAFRSFAIRQIRLFLFVGHDSMSSTLCYAIHLMSTNPETLCKIRAEHDQVLGKDLAAVSDKIRSNPNILNSLVYTTAVIKETLRIYPPGSGTRQGKAGVKLQMSNGGGSVPTEDCLVWTLHIAMQRAPEYWHEPDRFIPARWLKPEECGAPELQPRKWAWRPFEWGPRNCIGQNLALTELRISLALMMRTFDIRPAYDEWDSLCPPRSKGLSSYRGDRAFQVEEGAAHPADGYPCRVSLTPAGEKLMATTEV